MILSDPLTLSLPSAETQPSRPDFQTVLAALGLADQRVEPRHPCGGLVHCRSIALRPGVCCWAAVENLSRTGIGLLVPEPVRPNECLGITLSLAAPGVPRLLRAKSLHVARVDGELYRVGAAWWSPLALEEFHACLQVCHVE